MPDTGVPAVDGYIQTAPDSSGKKVDNSEVTRQDGTVVERERVVIGDDDSVSPTLAVSGETDRGAGFMQDRSVDEMLSEILAVMEDIRDLLHQAVNH